MTKRTKTTQAVLDDLVGQTEIAEYFGTYRGRVSMWITRSPGNGFPAPAKTLSAGKLYLLSEVVAWYDSNERLKAAS